MKPTLKAPGNQRLKLNYNELLSSFAFNFNLRRYTTATHSLVVRHLRKQYPGMGGKVVRAVRGVSVAVPEGECFGLLGRAVQVAPIRPTLKRVELSNCNSSAMCCFQDLLSISTCAATPRRERRGEDHHLQDADGAVHALVR